MNDTVVEKPHTDKNALICTYYGHAQGRHVRGLIPVSLLHQGYGLVVPLAVELVEKSQG